MAALMDEPKAVSLDIRWAELKAGLKVVHLVAQMDMNWVATLVGNLDITLVVLMVALKVAS